MGSVVVADQVELPGREAAADLLAEVEELRLAFAVTEPVEHLTGGEVERGEHVPDPAGAGVCGALPGRAPARKSAAAGSGLCRFSGPNSSTQITRPSAGGWS